MPLPTTPSIAHGPVLDIAALQRELRALLNIVSRLEERLDARCAELGELRGEFQVKGVTKPRPPSSGTSAPQQSEGQRRAMEGVSSIKAIVQPDGSALIHLDGRAGVALTASLARLLDVLKRDDGASPDHLVVWKPVAVLQEGLKGPGKIRSERAVRQLIYRLRQQLSESGENRWLVMSSEHGYRFALRREGAAVTLASNK